MPFRTDLAVEAAEPHRKNPPPGVSQSDREAGNLSINRVDIRGGEAAKLLGKPVGAYITVTLPSFSGPVEITETEIETVAGEICALLPPEGLVLVVGLGNNDITPDAIGPRTARQVLATRHIAAQMGAQAARDYGLDNLRAAASIAPGVLGQTGIETAEIVHSLVADIKPAAVLVIDALAARSASRLGNTIQIASSGISPGSGVMNARRELSRETLGVPVVSVGIPTVVDAATLAGDLLGEEEAGELREKFSPSGSEMMITPREIDQIVGRACKTLSLCINKALQRDVTLEELSYLVG